MTLALLITAVGGAWADETYPIVYDFEAAANAGENPANKNGSSDNGQQFYGWESETVKDYARNDYKGYSWATGSKLPEVCHVWRRSDRINGNVSGNGGLKCPSNRLMAVDGLTEGLTVTIIYDATNATNKEIVWAIGDGSSSQLTQPRATATINGVEAVPGQTTIKSGDVITVNSVTEAQNGSGYIVFKVMEDMVIKKIIIDEAKAASDVEVTTNAASAQDLFTEASFEMPTFDATVNYMLVRDMQDEANPVAFSGLPSSGKIIVKKGSNEKYQPVEALTIQLIDPLAAEDAKNIIAADGITIKVLVGAENELGAIDYDHDNPITLDAFLADMKPGYYWIKAESTDENSPYDGTVYSQEFLLLNGYELTIPAGEYATFYKDENLYTEDENAELYTISEVNATQAVLSDAVQIMPKNTPMLVYNKGTEEKTFLLIPTEDEANQVTAANEFKGTLSTMGMPGSTSITDYYVCTGKAFRWVKNAGTIAANKCWLQIGEQPATTRANTRSIVGGGNTTGIDGIENDESAVEGYYDLNGRKLQGKPTRGGIYIQNGRKVIVR